jgi:glucose/arabinose dehydrogenase
LSIRRVVCVVACVAAIASGCASASGSTSTTADLVDIGAGLKGPAAVHATVYATGVVHSSAFAFDASGRLWVATADETDAGRDRVYVVSAAGATPVAVLTGLHTPLGLVWYRNSLYVASKSGVIAYGGLAGTRFTTRRVVVRLASGVGEVNGIVVAPDGRMIVGISAPCDHCVPASKYSGSIIAFRPDGRNLTVYASGIRAPVGLAYVPGTDNLYVTMNYRDDLGTRTPGDALALVREGTRWGNPGCYGQGGSACRGVPDVVAHLDPHAAVSGVAIATGRVAASKGTSALVAEWSLGKVERVTITGAKAGAVSPFITGIANPVALAVKAGSALFVGDWTSGTVYEVAPA